MIHTVGGGALDAPCSILHKGSHFSSGADYRQYRTKSSDNPVLRESHDRDIPAENVMSHIPIDKSFQRADRVGYHFICSCLNCFSCIFCNCKDQMQVIWHDDVLIHLQALNPVCGANITVNCLSSFQKHHLRGVEVAAPYNRTEQFLFILCANRDKVITHIGVIETTQSICFSFWICFFSSIAVFCAPEQRN